MNSQMPPTDKMTDKPLNLLTILLKWTVLVALGVFAFWNGGSKHYFPSGSLILIIVFCWVCLSKLGGHALNRWIWIAGPLLTSLIIEWRVVSVEQRALGDLAGEGVREYAVLSLLLLAVLFLWVITVPEDQRHPFHSFKHALLLRTCAIAAGLFVASPGILEIARVLGDGSHQDLAAFQTLQRPLLEISVGIYAALVVREMLPATVFHLWRGASSNPMTG